MYSDSWGTQLDGGGFLHIIAATLKTLVIYNPHAGRFPARRIAEGAAAWWRARGWQVDIAGTRVAGEATQLARQAASAAYDAVIVAGGDGSLSQAADGLAGSPTALGVLPVGTSNVWARELRLPLTEADSAAAIQRLARAMFEARIEPVDLGRIGQRHFLLWAGVGLDAHIVSRVEPRERWIKRFGRTYYVALSFLAATDWAGADMLVEVDGVALRGRFLLAMAGNNRLYGGGLFRLSPGASLDDGLLEVWIFEGRSYGEALTLAWALYRGRHTRHPRVKCLAGRRISLVADPPLRVQADGDLLDELTPVTITVAPRALRVLAPPSAPADLFSRGDAK